MENRNQLRRAIDMRKRYLIKKLVLIGEYDPAETPVLFELTLSELEQEWKSVQEQRSEDGAG